MRMRRHGAAALGGRFRFCGNSVSRRPTRFGLKADARPAEVFGGASWSSSTGDGARQDRLGLAVVVVDDVGDHDGDVVGTAAAQRQFDEAVGTFGDVGDLAVLRGWCPG